MQNTNTKHNYKTQIQIIQAHSPRYCFVSRRRKQKGDESRELFYNKNLQTNKYQMYKDNTNTKYKYQKHK